MNSQTTQLKRNISFAQLLFFGLVFIGPAAAVGIFGTLDAKSGGAVATVYLVATVAMAFTALSYLHMARQVPRAGAVFAYAQAGLGKGAGYFAGWMVLLDYLLIPSVAYMFTGYALSSLFPAVPVWVFVAAAVLVTTALNLLGVTLASRVITVVVVLELCVLALVLVLGIVSLVGFGAARGWLTPFTGTDGFSWGAVLGAVSVAVLSYLGFDSLSTFAEETRGGGRAVGRATMICLVIAGVLFIAQSYVGALLSSTTPTDLAAHPQLQGAAFYAAVDSRLGGWLHWLLALAKGAGAAFSAMVGQAAGARILMDMSRSSRLPVGLAKVNARTGVPVVAVVIAAAGNVAVSLWAATRPDGLDALSSIVSVGALCAFILLNLSVPGYFLLKRADVLDGPGNRESRGGWSAARVLRYGVLPMLGCLILLCVLFSASRAALVMGAVWAVLGVIVAALMWFAHRRKRIGDAGGTARR